MEHKTFEKMWWAGFIGSIILGLGFLGFLIWGVIKLLVYFGVM